MREAGLVGASHRRGGPTTTRRDREARPAPDLVDRDVAAVDPNRLWVSDSTFIPSVTGFLYPAIVLDAWSRLKTASPSFSGGSPVAMAESFFSSLEAELQARGRFAS